MKKLNERTIIRKEYEYEIEVNGNKEKIDVTYTNGKLYHVIGHNISRESFKEYAEINKVLEEIEEIERVKADAAKNMPENEKDIDPLPAMTTDERVKIFECQCENQLKKGNMKNSFKPEPPEKKF